MSLADRLSDEQISEAREVFTMYAQGRILAAANINIALRSCNSNASAAEIKQHSKGATQFEFPDFLDLLAKCLEGGNGAAAILAAFKLYDKQGKGTVSQEDLMHLLCNTGEKIPKAQAKAFVDQYAGGAAEINYASFVAAIFK